MGACQIRQVSHFYKKIPKEQENQFWVNKIQVHYFYQTVKRIQDATENEFVQKEKDALAKIQAKFLEAQIRFKQAIQDFPQEFPGQYRTMKEDGESVEQYLGWTTLQEQFEDFKEQTVNRLQEVKDEKMSHFLKFYKIIQGELKQKEKQVPLSVYLAQQTVQEIYQTWKITHQNQVKMAKDTIDNRFKRDEKEEYYKKKFTSALDLVQLEKLAQRKPYREDVVEQGAQTGNFYCKLFPF